jgi:adenylate kinase
MAEAPAHLVILGPQGSGKGTQAERLASLLDASHIASGDLIRAEIRAGTERGKLVQSYSQKGKLVPDSLILDLVAEALSHPDRWILDGFPRTREQAEQLDAMLESLHERLDRVIALEAADEVLIERLGGRVESVATGIDYHVVYNPPPPTDPGPFVRREDDNPEAIRNRLVIYHTQTEPLEAYYEGRGILLRIDASPPVEEVTQAIISALGLAPAEGPPAGGAGPQTSSHSVAGTSSR